MFWRKKKSKKIDLLNLSDSERIQVINEIREKLQKRVGKKAIVFPS